MMKQIPFFVVVGVLSFSLNACESARSPELLDNPFFSTGYADGCQTGHSRVSGFDDTVTRNGALWETEDPYRIGWRDGYHACSGMQADPGGATDGEIFQTDSDMYNTAPR